MAVLFCVGYVYQRFLIQHAVDRASVNSMLLTFGVALMLQNAMIWVFSPDMKSITPCYAFTSFQLGAGQPRRRAGERAGGEPGAAVLPGRSC